MASTAKRRSRSVAFAVVCAVSTFAILSGVPAAAPTAPFLVGTWVNQADTGSSYFVSQNYHRNDLYMSWAGAQTHSGLRGTFNGTLDSARRQPDSAPSTSSSCSAGLTLRRTSAIRPSGPITNVVRSAPMYVRPYIDFSTQTP